MGFDMGPPARRTKPWLRLPGLVALAIFWWSVPVCGAEPERFPQYERDIWPILSAHCANCHGADEPKAGLDLRTVTAMLRGGESGPALVKSSPETSLLLDRIVAGEMPPPKQGKLAADEISLLRNWIKGGAPADRPDAVPPPVSSVRDKDRQFWSFRPLARPEIPEVRNADLIRTPIDAFLLSKLEARGLRFSDAASDATLVRRAYLDLLGIPPTPEELDAYLQEDAGNRYERLIDRLLDSPHFGERWGRHWLDVAGYVDTVGFDTDATNIILSEGKWKYRDYVIQAFNNDKPYDRFLTEQLAGDELHDWRNATAFTPEIRETLVATGYLRTARDLTHEDVGVIPQNFYGIMHDTLEIVGTGVLGLTLNCSRCHSHKFDPIPQEDYYRLMALMMPAYNPHDWRPVIPCESKLPDRGLADIAPVEKAARERHNAALDRQLEALRGKLTEIRQPHQAKLFDGKLAGIPEKIRDDTKVAFQTPADKRTEIQKYLAGKFTPALTVKPEELTAVLSEGEKTAVAEFERQMADAEKGRLKWGKIQALYDVAPPPTTHLLIRGNETTPGEEVVPGFLRVLCGSDADAVAAIEPPVEGTSGRRLALARWLTAPDTPVAGLVSRVIVNRVWQQLYGRGIVPTLDNFGVQGQAPTHPELLEWLSADFIAKGWRFKTLIKQLMLSSAYRQASHRSSAGTGLPMSTDPEQVDPGNELLWKMRMRRLESESVRDSILAVTGKLNRAAGGPPILINAKPDGMVVVANEKLTTPADQWRRSIYFVTRRAYNLSILTVFDQPLVATNCLKRDASAVPLQSLVMLNDAFLAEQAEALALRIEHASPAAPARQIDDAFRRTLVRHPNAGETATCAELLRNQSELALAAGATAEAAAHQALVQLCHTLLNTSEFLYVE